MCLRQRCWWKELWDGCERTCKSLCSLQISGKRMLTGRHRSTYLVWVWWLLPCCNETCKSTLILDRQLLMTDCVYVHIRICLKRPWDERDLALSRSRARQPLCRFTVSITYRTCSLISSWLSINFCESQSIGLDRSMAVLTTQKKSRIRHGPHPGTYLAGVPEKSAH
jgi:hypothetical protein